jgi:hypothetical protein
MGVVSCGLLPKTPWRDLVLDLEFQTTAGDGFELYLRYWPDRRWYTLTFRSKDGYETGTTYQIKLRIRGSRITLSSPGQPDQSDVLSLNTSRTGGIGFGLTPGTKVTITSCKVKILR